MKARVQAIFEPQVYVLRDERRPLHDSGTGTNNEVRDVEFAQRLKKLTLTGLQPRVCHVAAPSRASEWVSGGR